jgi:hypothetical protein
MVYCDGLVQAAFWADIHAMMVGSCQRPAIYYWLLVLCSHSLVQQYWITIEQSPKAQYNVSTYCTTQHLPHVQPLATTSYLRSWLALDNSSRYSLSLAACAGHAPFCS